MGKRYYCDYCDRSFADGAENRKKHLASVNHQKLRKAHYEMFKDAATILEENKKKNPCRKFKETGYCEFGPGCKFSHLTPSDVQYLEEQVRAEEMARQAKNPRIETDIHSWIESKVSKVKEHYSSALNDDPQVLPPILANIPNLPPSLIPPTAFEFYRGLKNAPEWG